MNASEIDPLMMRNAADNAFECVLEPNVDVSLFMHNLEFDYHYVVHTSSLVSSRRVLRKCAKNIPRQSASLWIMHNLACMLQ